MINYEKLDKAYSIAKDREQFAALEIAIEFFAANQPEVLKLIKKAL